MFELWLISCLSALGTLCFIFALLGLVGLIVYVVGSVLNKGFDPESSYHGDKKAMGINNELRRLGKPFMYIGIVCAFLCCIIPTTQEGYMIFGLGSVIDSVQERPVAQNFDDKLYKAIDLCLDRYIGSEEHDTVDKQEQVSDSTAVSNHQKEVMNDE